ncbi:MAG: Ribosomal-protein-alanine acetyltransferase [Anaerolineales bacterium]|nr:Ribosomal-protein-alanine acetyltransferase [Anaerolineales bacterium]
MVTGAIRRRETFQGLRPFSPARDLDGVAELLRIAFREELGRRETAWLQEMQTISALKPVIWLLDQVNIAIGKFLHGFVWIEDDRIVGNATINRLSPENWLISNVAVHPDYRRRGIARDLMAAGVEWIRERHVRWVTLEVRRDNDAAKSLYFDMGFVVVNGTTDMERASTRSITRTTVPEGYRLRLARADDGRQMFELARLVTPELARRIKPIDRQEYELGTLKRVVDGVRRLVGLPATVRWVATNAGECVVAMVELGTSGYDHRLQMLVHPDLHGVLEETLVTRALDSLSGRRGSVRAKADADHTPAIDVLREYGFREIRTLDRMALELHNLRQVSIRRMT